MGQENESMPLNDVGAFACVLDAWHQHEQELRGFLLKSLDQPDLAEDFVQEVFMRAMKSGKGFCGLDNPRAWLFTVARNAVVDHARLKKQTVSVDERLPVTATEERAPVDELETCIARNLEGLNDEDRDIIERCDLEGMSQQDYADLRGLTLSAAKSRIKRARQRLRETLNQRCQVRYDESGAVCCHVPPPRA